jgi:hypothetical protein
MPPKKEGPLGSMGKVNLVLNLKCATRLAENSVTPESGAPESNP